MISFHDNGWFAAVSNEPRALQLFLVKLDGIISLVFVCVFLVVVKTGLFENPLATAHGFDLF